ncbi:MAG TPA: LysR family transcriptional regulator [Nitrospiraceae bacterium]|nr:LysR family transcriptional regulator [Nitrospiraceae bacterium]
MNLHDRISHRLKLRDLRLLLALNDWGSMAKAANHLNLTQSAVSKAITELEHTFGVRLFDRTPKGIEPTAYGRALLKGSAGVFDELRQSVNEIEHLSDPTVGELRIGCTPPMSWGVVPAVIERLVRQHPRLALHVVEADPATLRYHELPERRIDLAIGRIMGPIPGDDIDAEVLFTEKAFVVAGRNSRWAKRRKIDLAELVSAPWCAPTQGSFARSLLADAFKEEGLPAPQINAVSFSIPLFSALLATGNFLCVLPNSMLQLGQHLLSVKVLPIDLPARPSPAGIITLKKRTLSPVARLFIEHAREVTKPLGRPK